ncbi:MAG: DUF4214 domain-containing protein [Acidobacteriota bacterium]
MKPKLDPLGKPCGSDEAFVTSLYESILHRKPDRAGFGNNLGLLQQGTSREAIYRRFFSSEEYTSKHKSAKAFLEDAYRAILARPPDASGMDLWLGRMQRGVSRRDVINGLLSSPEFKQIRSGCS